jgi:serine/threonine-protein kinase CTR1
VKELNLPEQPEDTGELARDAFKKRVATTTESFVQEVSICCDLAHPNLVRMLGYSAKPTSKGEGLLLVQEFLSGKALDAQLYVEGWRPTALQVLKAAIDIARGMEYLHTAFEGEHGRNPVMHRDLKSPNLLLATAPPPEGQEDRIVVKIADFGLSTEKLVDEEATQTMLMTGCGSVLWMAPEILMGSVYNEKVDVFSYAMCLVELVDFHLPWHGCANTPEVAVKCTRGERPDKQLRSADPQMKELIEQCWHKEPRRRLTFAQVLTHLGVSVPAAPNYDDR